MPMAVRKRPQSRSKAVADSLSPYVPLTYAMLHFLRYIALVEHREGIRAENRQGVA